MRKSLSLAVLACGVVAGMLWASAALAQQGAAARPAGRGPQFALIDIGKIFKNNVRLKQQLADLQVEKKKADERFQAEREELRKMAEALKDYTAGSPDYEQLERKIADRKARMSVDFELQLKEFMKSEAKIYFSAYQRVAEEVEAYAAANGTLMVLKYNSEAPDPEKPEDISRELNKPIVWSHQALDITEIISEGMSRQAQAPRGSGGFPPPRR